MHYNARKLIFKLFLTNFNISFHLTFIEFRYILQPYGPLLHGFIVGSKHKTKNQNFKAEKRLQIEHILAAKSNLNCIFNEFHNQRFPITTVMKTQISTPINLLGNPKFMLKRPYLTCYK